MRSRPLVLTQDGKQFLQTAKQILQLKQQYEGKLVEEHKRRAFRAAGDRVHRRARDTAARAARLSAPEPRHLREAERESPEVLQKTLSYDGVDLVIGSINNTPDTYETIPLCRKEQLLVVPKPMLRRLAGDEYEEKKAEFSAGADLSYFESLPFIKIPRLSSGGRTLNSYLKYYDINPKFVCELTNVENAFQLAISGIGVFIYPELFWDMLAPDVQGGLPHGYRAFPLPYLPDIESVCAYYHKETGLHGKTRLLFDSFLGFFEKYKAKKSM